MIEIAITNNDIITQRTDQLLQNLNSQKVAMGIKHNRTQPPRKAKAKFRYAGGEINVVGVIMSKGEVMTHKGKGRMPSNRVEKPWFNPEAEKYCNDLADAIAMNTGDVIGGNLAIR